MKLTSLVLSLAVSICLSAGTALASIPDTPEFRLVEGLYAASAIDLGSTEGRQRYQQELQKSIASYEANHTQDAAVASQNFAEAFSSLGFRSNEVAQIRSVSAHYGDAFRERTAQGPMSAEESREFWQQYGQALSNSLQSISYPQGAQYSACQWSVAIMAGGLVIGIPALVYTIGNAMGDRNVSPVISNGGGLAFLVGIGALIATIPTCLF